MDFHDNSLVRTGNPRSLPHLEYRGSFPADTHNYLEVSHSRKRKKKRRSEKKKKDGEMEDLEDEIESDWRIDYVLVYKYINPKEIWGYSELQEFNFLKELREKFQNNLVEKEKVILQEEVIGEYVYVKLHCPFARLCQEAERVNLEMNLKGAAILPKNKGFMAKFHSLFKTDDEVDFVSAPFITQKRAVFDGIDNPDTFFRSSQRSFLVHNILINMDVRNNTDKPDDDYVRRKDVSGFLPPGVVKKGLPYMLMKKAYCDAFILHDETPYESMTDDERDAMRKESKKSGTFIAAEDAREELQRTWCRWTKYQPLWKIRNYFGEQIAFYFAWAGSLATLLWFPVLIGLITWGLGLYVNIAEFASVRAEQNELLDQKEQLRQQILRYNRTEDREEFQRVESQLEEWELIDFLTEGWLTIFKDSFDTSITPYFALLICLWGTVFLEVWKRKSSTVAYEWDVDSYEFSEPDRPQFFGTKNRPDPVSDLPDWYYPFYKQFLKFMMSLGILIFMISLVIATALGVIMYRLLVSYLLSSNSNSILRFLAASLVASVANSTMIMILGRVYEFIAVKLTDWENHRTQSLYDNALIIKLFAFSFVNTYTSLFYIAFFRELTTVNGIFGLGENYTDSCSGGNCMSMLSLQVFVLMIMKPCPKFFKDIILPWGRRLIFKYKCWGRNKVIDSSTEDLSQQAQYTKKEHMKPPVQNFTLSEYNEKVILFGFIMIFSSALPIAPLIALIVLLLDLRIDARRLLWFNRRPIALIASNIGMWYSILQFLSYVGVITNAFIIAFRSSWAAGQSVTYKLWVVIGFEHIVFAVKFLLAYMIPDVPSDVSLAMRRQKYQVAKIIGEAKIQPPLKLSKDTYSSVGVKSVSSEVQNGLKQTNPSEELASTPSSEMIYGDDTNNILQEDEDEIISPRIKTKTKKKKKKKKKNQHDPDNTAQSQDEPMHMNNSNNLPPSVTYPSQTVDMVEYPSGGNHVTYVGVVDGIHGNSRLAYPPTAEYSSEVVLPSKDVSDGYVQPPAYGWSVM